TVPGPKSKRPSSRSSLKLPPRYGGSSQTMLQSLKPPSLVGVNTPVIHRAAKRSCIAWLVCCRKPLSCLMQNPCMFERLCFCKTRFSVRANDRSAISSIPLFSSYAKREKKFTREVSGRSGTEAYGDLPLPHGVLPVQLSTS